MAHRTHKTLTLFALLLLALTSFGSTESLKTFESSQKSYSIKAPTSFVSKYHPSKDKISLSKKTQHGRIAINIGSIEVNGDELHPPTLLEQTLHQLPTRPNFTQTFSKKNIKFSTPNGTIYLRKGELSSPHIQNGSPFAQSYSGVLVLKKRTFLFQGAHPIQDKSAKQTIFSAFKSLKIK